MERKGKSGLDKLVSTLSFMSREENNVQALESAIGSGFKVEKRYRHALGQYIGVLADQAQSAGRIAAMREAMALMVQGGHKNG